MGAAAFLLVAFAALVIWLRYVALPDVDRWRPDILHSIERSSGMAVGVTAMRGGWGGLRPVLSLEGVSINDKAGRAAFKLERAEVTLSWWSLFLGQVRFYDLDFYRPDLVLRRGADGLIYLADKPINTAGPGGDGAFTEWLLAQPRLAIHDATLTWRDDYVGAPEVRLTAVEIAVERKRGRHLAALSAAPPRALAARIDLRADVALERDGAVWRARGQGYGETLNADLARLRNHLPVPETLRTGMGSLRLWLGFDAHGITEATGDVALRDARVQLAADALPLALASLSGRAVYEAGPAGFSLSTERLRFRLGSGEEAQPGRFSISRMGAGAAPSGTGSDNPSPRTEVTADNIDLKIAATLLDYFPVPRDVKNQVLRFAPRGRIADARVSWSDDGGKAFSVKGRLENVAVNAVDAFPGMGGITGTIEGTEKGGVVRLGSKNVTFDAASLFAGPLAFDEVDAVARWQHDDVLGVTIDEARLASADGELKFSGKWRSAWDEKRRSPGIVDFKGTLGRVVLRRLPAYLPNNIAPTRAWLERSLSAGELNARWELRGDLWEFPFGREAPGLFLVDGQVRNGRLVYHPQWPSIDAIAATVRFENRKMDIRAKQAAIFASRVTGASALIADFGAVPVRLVVEGEIESTSADAVRFLRESPLADGPGAFTRAVAVEGPGALKLRLDYPLSGDERARVAGEWQFAGATASIGRGLAMSDLRGKLAFTERDLRAPEIAGSMFGRPATLALSMEPDGRVLTKVEGSIDAAGLAAYLPAPIAARLAGESGWTARAISGPQGTDITMASDMKGIASRLPRPLDKGADAVRNLSIQVERAGAEGEAVSAALEGGIFWRSSRASAGNAERWQVALKMGAPVAGEPVREGLWLYGAAEGLDADAWIGVFPEATRSGAPAPANEAQFGLRGIDMRLARLRYLGREFSSLGVRLEHRGDQWKGTLDGPQIAGAVEWRGEGRGRLVARLKHVAMPESVQEPSAAQTASQDPPALDIVVDRFHFRGRELGKLEAGAEYAGDDWRISRLDITSGQTRWRSSGAWRRTGSGSLTTLAVKLEAGNLNELMALFGYGDYVKGGSGRLEGTLAWAGYPNDFSTSILSGSFAVTASRGQFAKLEPGAGKLLGLLSLQSLPRRAMLDFRDVFSEGFAFESIEGDVKVARGVLLTDNFTISGPSALVTLSGEASLPRETQTLVLRVVPEMGETAAVAATVLGTPVLGLSTLLVSKLLSNPLGKAASYEYSVTGSWDNPVVTKISAPPPPPPAPAKAAAAAEAKK